MDPYHSPLHSHGYRLPELAEARRRTAVARRPQVGPAKTLARVVATLGRLTGSSRPGAHPQEPTPPAEEETPAPATAHDRVQV